MQNIQKEASSLYGPIRKAVRKIISETITDGAMKRILKQYEGPDGNGTLADTNVDLAKLLSDVRQELLDEIMKNAEEAFDECDVIPKLAKLKELSAKCDNNARGWRPSGIPKKDMVGVMLPVARNQVDRLKASRDALLAKLKERQERIKDLYSHTEALYDNLAKCIDNDNHTENLQAEALYETQAALTRQ